MVTLYLFAGQTWDNASMDQLVAGMFIVGGLITHLETAFQTYGYPIIFGLILLECAGLPLPGETFLLAGGVAAHQGDLSLFWVIVVAASAAIIGDNLGYLVGRKGGRLFLERYGRILHVRENHIAILDGYFRDHGAKTVFAARWVAFLRVWGALFAGASRMHWKRFVIFNALGGITWVVTMATLAYMFASSVKTIARVFGVAGWVLAGLVLIAVVVVVRRAEHWRLRKAAAVAAAAAGGDAATGADAAAAAAAPPPAADALPPAADAPPDPAGVRRP
jgi:membrane protein DedA with SNARE-associated domain